MSEIVATLTMPDDPAAMHEVLHALERLYGGPLALQIEMSPAGFSVVREPESSEEP